MKHTIHSFAQGSREWAEHRGGCNNASDLAAAQGISAYKPRADLIREIATGFMPEIDAATQKRFDDGHRFEALARAYAEETIICGALYPVTISIAVDGLSRPLSASLDGATDDDEINFEHKTLNAALAAALDQGMIPNEYCSQMEQGMLINGAHRTLFMASKWDDDDVLLEEKHCWYESRQELRAKIIPTWKQVEEDAANYQHQEVIPSAVAAPQETLPAVSVQVTGSIAVIDNLSAFGGALMAYVERINKSPKTDEDFATLEATVKALKKAEDALDAAEANALGQTASLDTLRRTIDQYRAQARANRLLVEKIVKAEKENRRNAIMQGGINALREHIDTLNKRLGKSYMPDTQWANFPVAMKGLKTMASLQNAVDTELAQAKINSSACADRIEINLKGFTAFCGDTEYGFLFRDMPALVLKAPDDFAAVVTLRINEHKAAEAAKIEAQRARIQAEEEAKAKAAQDALLAAERTKMEAEVLAKAKAEQDAQAAITLPSSASRSTETAIQPAAQAVQAPSGGQPQEPAVIAATHGMTTGHLHDLIDDATKDMSADELMAVLDFATEIRSGFRQIAA